ncbi:MAG: cytochrome c biogenesis protein CcsA [Chitinophagales bacterium]
MENQLLKRHWWKYISIALLLYTIIGGFLLPVPRLDIVNESIRNTYFHIPMWFGMMLIFLASLVYSIKYLRDGQIKHDLIASETAYVGLWFGAFGLLTGMMWGKFTWGSWWPNDVKIHTSAVTLLIYAAYFILRGGMDDADKRAKVSSVYNIFAFSMMIPLLFVIPRMVDSLHPGNGGNPAFGSYDLDSTMRMVFYPAIIGWTLLGFWMASLRIRLQLLVNKKLGI